MRPAPDFMMARAVVEPLIYLNKSAQSAARTILRLGKWL
jgi:hypothetical protein